MLKHNIREIPTRKILKRNLFKLRLKHTDMRSSFQGRVPQFEQDTREQTALRPGPQLWYVKRHGANCNQNLKTLICKTPTRNKRNTHHELQTRNTHNLKQFKGSVFSV